MCRGWEERSGGKRRGLATRLVSSDLFVKPRTTCPTAPRFRALNECQDCPLGSVGHGPLCGAHGSYSTKHSSNWFSDQRHGLRPASTWLGRISRRLNPFILADGSRTTIEILPTDADGNSDASVGDERTPARSGHVSFGAVRTADLRDVSKTTEHEIKVNNK